MIVLPGAAQALADIDKALADRNTDHISPCSLILIKRLLTEYDENYRMLSIAMGGIQQFAFTYEDDHSFIKEIKEMAEDALKNYGHEDMK